MGNEAIEKEQRRVKKFAEHVKFANHAPHPIIVQLIDENRFPFFQNSFFSYDAPKLASDEFNRCVELYLNRGENGTAMDAMRLMHEIMCDEVPHREELQELAISVVREMYDVPCNLDLSAMLVMPDIEEDCYEFENTPEEEEMLTNERKTQLQQHIEKRIILNDIVHGAAVHQWTSAYFIALERIEELNPELCDKYNKLSALINYWNWQFYYGDTMPPILQGINQCCIGDRKIKAKAMNFPVLIHELSKGVLDFIVSAGIPNLPPHELKYVYKEADKYAHEQWHYFFGPTLWRSILNTSDVTSQKLPNILSAMSKMPYLDLAAFCTDITFHPDEIGKKQMDELKKSCL